MDHIPRHNEAQGRMESGGHVVVGVGQGTLLGPEIEGRLVFIAVALVVTSSTTDMWNFICRSFRTLIKQMSSFVNNLTFYTYCYIYMYIKI